MAALARGIKHDTAAGNLRTTGRSQVFATANPMQVRYRYQKPAKYGFN